MLQLSPLLLLLFSVFSTIIPAIGATLGSREPSCAFGYGCDTDGAFCCGIHCCSREQECVGGECEYIPIATAQPSITVATWYPPVSCPVGQTCLPDLPQFSISGNGFSVGDVSVGIFQLDGSAVWATTVQDILDSTDLASFGVETTVVACDTNPIAAQGAFAQATDERSGLVSNQVRLVFVPGCSNV